MQSRWNEVFFVVGKVLFSVKIRRNLFSMFPVFSEHTSELFAKLTHEGGICTVIAVNFRYLLIKASFGFFFNVWLYR